MVLSSHHMSKHNAIHYDMYIMTFSKKNKKNLDVTPCDIMQHFFFFCDPLNCKGDEQGHTNWQVFQNFSKT